MAVGEIFKQGRIFYEVVAVFVDDNKTFYVAKCNTTDGGVSYSNIFTLNEKGELYKRR